MNACAAEVNSPDKKESEAERQIVFENVSFSYGDDAPDVISGVSLEIRKGEFVALVGRNGSGKSTLARLVNGLIAPRSGKITVLGMDAADKKNLFKIRSSCGVVFQNPDNQMVASIVEDDVAFGPENVGLGREEIGERINFALKATGTEEFRHRPAAGLSGGQKQRVAVAGVIALKPKILILDESTSMLDPAGREEVMSVVRKLNKEEKMTVIVITHYMDEVALCDRVVVLSGGSVTADGAPRRIFSDGELLARAGLELPIPMKIASLLKSRNIDVGTCLDEKELGDRLCESFRKI